MRRLVLELAAAISLTVAAAVSFVTAAQANGMMVTGAFARASATPAAKAGAVYFTIRNDGDVADKLTAVQTDAAQMAMLHENVEENGVVSMRHLEAITIAPKETVALGPRKTHVMLTGLKAPLKKGERLTLTLTFEKAGTILVDVPVGGVAADGPE
ncbi:copper chaperone PCu(A)C [Nordella sp. HKS 07]|uniref:copper chaperone PCu(A)C n=1 Tax=Nordella sp. HKS 07 TaxID=2712222 RepID=UPI0013E1A2C1|nr:copper chaperone PCu(A)C [Nordella sp. HKS 07]QIG50046.1 copper chaperone PCu(A)C [Nordella sp. HKS 07]